MLDLKAVKTARKGPMDMQHARSNRRVFRVTTLTAALLAAYVYAPTAAGVNLVVETPYDMGASSMSNSTATVNNGGILTGNGASVSGSAYDLMLVNSGGNLNLTNTTLTNTVAPNQNGRAVTVSGSNATATLNDSTIVLNAFNGYSGGHAFTAGVGTVDGGHAAIDGGTITASGSKRTVGIQANDGGSIDASNVVINTNSTFGHAVNAYRTVASPETATVVKLNNVTINTYDLVYADGIQSANKGARVEAIDTDITTVGTNSFGAEVFNGATASFTGGSITTSGTTAAGVRVYGGALGNGAATISGTHINTAGAGAVGVVAADIAEQTSGTISLTNTTIETHGANAAAVQASYGSQITSGGGNTLHTYGANSTGAAASTGASISLGSDTVTAELGNGLSSDGAGSTISTDGTTVLTKGGRDGAYATNGGSIDLIGGSVTNAGAGSGGRYGIRSDGVGSTITTDGTTILTSGVGSYVTVGAYALNGGTISLTGGSVSNANTAAGAVGISAIGAGSTITGLNVALSAKGEFTSAAELSHVVSVKGGASISLTGGSVSSLSSQFGRGIFAIDKGSVTTSGVAISTVGNFSNAVHAYSNQKTVASTPDSASIQLTGGSITTSGDEANGLSAQNIDSVIGTNMSGSGSTSITTSGDNSYGAVAYNGGTDRKSVV